MSEEKALVFISHSSRDKPTARRIAHELNSLGIEVWFDEWEIMAGDSLVQKIFSEGLSNATAFLMLISKNSIDSAWVKEELDYAVVSKIEDVTRVIPVLLDDVKVPAPLRSLLWVDLREDFKSGLHKISNAVTGVSEKPALGSSTSTVLHPESVAGLSKNASYVGLCLMSASLGEDGRIYSYKGTDLMSICPGLSETDLNDSVDELEELGAVRIIQAIGTAPFNFARVESTYILFQEFAQYLDYSPDDDVKIIAAAIANHDQIGNKKLHEETELSISRLNRAVAYLIDYDYVDSSKTLGNYPYSFSNLMATRRTRQFVQSQ